MTKDQQTEHAMTSTHAIPEASADRGMVWRVLFPVLVYAVFSALWILLSDHAVALFYKDPEGIRVASTLKGWFFVAVTSLLLFVLINRLLGQVLRLEAGKNEESRSRARVQRLLEEILDSSNDAIFAKDRDGRYQLFNREVSRVAGVAPAMVLGHDDKTLFPDEQARIIRENDLRVMRENRVVTYEERVSTVDGERTYLATKGPLHDLDGVVSGMFGISRDITDRKRDEENLQKYQGQLRAFIEHAPLSIAMFDRGMNYLVTSGRWLIDYGRGHGNLIGRNHYDVHPDMPEGWRDVHQRGMRGETVKNDEEMWIQADGSRHWLRWAVLPWRNEAGEIGGIIISAEDITAPKLVEEARRKSDERYLTVLENAADPIFITDPDGRYVYVNQQAIQLLGYAKDELLSMSIADVTPEEDRAHSQETFAELIEQRRMKTELLLLRKDGRQVPVEINAIMLPDGNAFGACRDISERRRIERELELHRHHLEKLVAARTRELSNTASKLMDTQFAMNSVGIGIHWVDAENGRFLYVNRIAAEMLGYSVDEMLAMSVPEIDPDFSLAAFDSLTGRLKAEGHAHFETFNRMRDGALLPVEISLHYLEARDGERPRFIAFVTDISARKEAELALLQAKETAEAATRSKSAFLANMSHEIRTPMNGILGLAHLLRKDATARQTDFLDKIAASGKYLLGVINDILDLSKIEAGKLVLEQKDFLLDDLLRGIDAVMSGTISARSLAYVVDMEGMPAGLRGDPTRISQVLVNFLGNAVKFTERGTITLRGRLLDSDENGYRVRFSVVDTGIGIPPEQHGRLFDAFEQADSSTTRRFGGTGLGLAINRRIAELYDGAVGVDSVPGEGSTFWIELRLGRASVLASAPVELPGEVALALLLRDFKGTRVLVAEDNPINQQVALMMLDECGLSAELAEDGRQAVEMAGSAAYALILMDMQMPEMDGIEATRLIRALPAYAGTPILAMTANAFDDDLQTCLDAGMNDFVSKPVDPEKFHETLLRWLSQAR